MGMTAYHLCLILQVPPDTQEEEIMQEAGSVGVNFKFVHNRPG